MASPTKHLSALVSLGALCACVSATAPKQIRKPTSEKVSEPQTPPSPQGLSSPARPSPVPGMDLEAPLQPSALPLSSNAMPVAEMDRHLAKGHPEQALALLDPQTLDPQKSPAMALVYARAQRMAQDHDGAAKTIDALAGTAPSWLVLSVATEQGILAHAQARYADAIAALKDPVKSSAPIHSELLWAYAESLARHAPAAFLEEFEDIEPRHDPKDMDIRSKLLGLKSDVLQEQGQQEQAIAIAHQRFVEEPVSLLTPELPPEGVVLSPQDWLARGKNLAAEHRNEKVIAAMAKVDTKALTPAEFCDYRFVLGMAHRKLHHYKDAETMLMSVTKDCDETLARRAMYVGAKVISIRSGLRAIATIEDFAKRFSGHSMVDDVLFWAGDLYQRRNRYSEANPFYERIVSMETKGDHCADATWRMAWMAYHSEKFDDMRQVLEQAITDRDCSKEPFDFARARFWLGRVAEIQKQPEQAAAHYAKLWDEMPLGYYAQMGLKRLLALFPERRAAWKERLQPPEGDGMPPLCVGPLKDNDRFHQGLRYLLWGLHTDARILFETLAKDSMALSVAGPQSDGEGSQGAADENKSHAVCADIKNQRPRLALALLMDQAGAHREAHWTLRTEFKSQLAQLPNARTIGVYRAAYPLAYRDAIAASEKENELPELFLQALSREESAFDPEVVSWAGAYGLSQLLLSSAQRAGAYLKPPVKVEVAEEILEPGLNARLGGALLKHLFDTLGNHPGLVLVAYNAGDDFALRLWRRHQSHDFERFAEEVSIRETRGYVMRVLKTYGIYRWLYDGKLPELPVSDVLPDYVAPQG